MFLKKQDASETSKSFGSREYKVPSVHEKAMQSSGNLRCVWECRTVSNKSHLLLFLVFSFINHSREQKEGLQIILLTPEETPVRLWRNLYPSLRVRTLRTPSRAVIESDRSMATAISQEAQSPQLCARNSSQKPNTRELMNS